MDNLSSKEGSQKRLHEMQREVHRMKVMHRCSYYITQYKEEVWTHFLESELWKPYYQSLNYSQILEEYIVKDNNKPLGYENHTGYLQAVVDKERKQYLLISIGHDSDGHDEYGVIYHLALKGDIVIIYANNTDKDLEDEFKELGIAPIDLVDG